MCVLYPICSILFVVSVVLPCYCYPVPCRDLLLEVNQEDVSQMSLRDIPRRIEQAARPITIKLERIVMELDFLDVLKDPRKVSQYTAVTPAVAPAPAATTVPAATAMPATPVARAAVCILYLHVLTTCPVLSCRCPPSAAVVHALHRGQVRPR